MAGNEKLGFGIVGCGSVSEIHARALKKLDSTELVAVYSRSEDNAKSVGEEHGTDYHTDWEEFINRDDLDVVSICTPSGTHLDYGKRSAEAGKHVVVEKPIEVTVEKGQQLIDICKQNGVHLSVIFQNRFIPDVLEMKKSIDNGTIGKVHLADAYIKWFRDQEYYDSGGWRGTFALDGGGALINQSIHTIDLLQWMVGDVSSVFGKIGTFTHKGIEGEDTGVAVINFRNGPVGVIEGATSVFPAQERMLEIHGDKGTAILKGNIFTLKTGEDTPEQTDEGEEGGASSPFAGFSIQPHMSQFDEIVKAIHANEESSVTGEEALKSLAIIRGIYESSQSNSMVDLS
ncbi:MAG: gfo/Idh/MocA family oxidoreductase [Candidatus Marinimicrobia bacterium]|nr:gfo/Idh/MocA family oxidoreductase [Candidatus Neomarinimicrobiota bacterium]